MKNCKIVNVGCEIIEANCAFNYKGYVISISTIFTPHHVAILKDGEFVKNEINEVEEAIYYVDELTSKEN